MLGTQIYNLCEIFYIVLSDNICEYSHSYNEGHVMGILFKNNLKKTTLVL